MRFGDLAVLVDDVRDPLRVFVLLARRRAVRQTDLALGVAQQREGEIELLRELRVVRRRVETDAEDLRVFRLVLRQEVPEPGTFQRSAGCVGLRIEPQHHFAAAQIAELHAIAVVVRDVEIGCGIAGTQHVNTSKDVPQFAAKRHR
jgi:hypothetical protein